MTIDGEDPADWESYSKKLPVAALGKNVRFEFRFNSDDFDPDPFDGWYLDNVIVTVP